MAQQNAWQAVVEALKAEGVSRVYGIPGSPKHLFDALYDAPEIQVILVRHEAAAVFMAMAEARLAGRPAVCFASPGPGLANLTAGMLEAYSACSPIILLGPGTPTDVNGLGAFQEADQIGILRPVTKWAVRVEWAERMPWTLHRAFSLATCGKPGPVYVEVPGDLALTEIDMPAYIPTSPPPLPAPDPRAVREAVDQLLAARRPVLIAGGGAVLSRAGVQVQHLAELLGLPIMTTPAGRGIVPETHPLVMGMTGIYFNRLSSRMYQAADLMLSVGCRHEELESGAWKYYPSDARFVQIDIDPFEIGRNFMPSVAMIADARMSLAAMIAELQRRSVDPALAAGRSRVLAESRRRYEMEVAEECRTDEVPIRTKRVVYELNEVFGPDTVLVCENGSQDLWSYYYPYYKILNAGDCMVPAEQTCMGMGVAGAVGAKLARPDKKVVCTTGDGAFQMYMEELPTAVQYKAPVTWIVLNNNALGWPKLTSRALGHRYLGVDYTVQPDFVLLARANHCHGERVTEPGELEGALRRALESGQPAVIDVMIEHGALAPVIYWK